MQEMCLADTPANLASNNPVLQRLAVSRLQLLLWRPAWWPQQWQGGAAQQIAERGLLHQLAALVKPGTDAGEGFGFLILKALPFAVSVWGFGNLWLLQWIWRGMFLAVSVAATQWE
jgi:hypothetical protein